MLRLISVTPGVMLSCAQPEAAVRLAAGGRREQGESGESCANHHYVPYSVASGTFPRNHATAKSKPTAAALAQASRPGGRFVDMAYQPLQAQRQSTPLLFREKAAQLTLTAVRLDGEPARMQACCGAAQFNLRPMPREHDLSALAAKAGLDAHVRLGHRDALGAETPLHRAVQRPPEQRQFGPCKGQHRPEAAQGQNTARCRPGRCRQGQRTAAHRAR